VVACRCRGGGADARLAGGVGGTVSWQRRAGAMNWKPPKTGEVPAGWQPITPPTAPQKSKQRPLVAAVLIVIGLAVVFAMVSGDDDEGGGGSDRADEEYMAHAMCAEFTRNQLKAPASADFPEYNDRGVRVLKGAGTRWVVSSFVDAENSFGANVRTSFRCEVSDVGDQWQLIDWAEMP
jgi:hypothetical protein